MSIVSNLIVVIARLCGLAFFLIIGTCVLFFGETSIPVIAVSAIGLLVAAVHSAPRRCHAQDDDGDCACPRRFRHR